MNLCLVVSVAFARIVKMPMGPIPSELQIGKRIAQRNLGPDSVFLGARQITGRWFDGSKRQVIEEVIWLSPDFLSRWLGYLSIKEDWDEFEIETRWIKLKARLMNEMAFIVRVSALEKVDPFELGINTDPDSKSI